MREAGRGGVFDGACGDLGSYSSFNTFPAGGSATFGVLVQMLRYSPPIQIRLPAVVLK